MSIFNIDKVISQLKNWNKKTNEKLYHKIRKCHVTKHLFSSSKNCEIKKSLDDVEKHDTLDRDEDHKKEVIKPVMFEPEDSSDSEDEHPLTWRLPKKSHYDFEFIKKVVEWQEEYKEKHKSYSSFSGLPLVSVPQLKT